MTLVFCLVPVSAAQRGWLREEVRIHGDVNREMSSCGPPTGLKEIVNHTTAPHARYFVTAMDINHSPDFAEIAAAKVPALSLRRVGLVIHSR